MEWMKWERISKTVIPSESRGIPMRYLKAFMTGSLDCARDDTLMRFDKVRKGASLLAFPQKCGEI